MFDQEIKTGSKMTETSAPFAPAANVAGEVVDLAVLVSFEELQEDGGADLVVELVELYLQDAPVKINAIRQAVAQDDRDSLTRAAHSLKGSSGTLGVRQLASVCEELEYLPGDPLTSDATALVDRLQGEFVRVQEVLTSELHRRSDQVSTTNALEIG
jgi:HPt (histidine-containing phosphotransfer) domain-containing protein